MRFNGTEIIKQSCPILKKTIGIGKKSISLMLAGNTNQRGRLSIFDLLIRIACVVKSADLN
jgi:hypothetical protein